MNLSQAIRNRFGITYEGAEDMWFSILCPFHNDNNPSASINFKLQRFTCKAGCEGRSLKTMAKDLEIEYDGLESETMVEEDWLNYLIDTTAVRKKPLKQQAKEFADFLISRQLKLETIEEFNGEYISDQSHQDYGHLVIPYGRNKYVKRRIIDGTDSRFKQSGNQGSGDNKSLFGRPEYWRDKVILCEGITDYLTLWQQEIREGCATFGANTSDAQMYLLRGKTVFILFDRDFSGYTGARKAAEQLKKYNAIPIILEIPKEFGDADTDKVDVNSAYVHSGDKFINWLLEQINSYSVFDTDYIRGTFLENKRTVKYISTGIMGLDRSLNGGFATGLHAIAGMPEAGKSTLVSYLINEFVESDHKVLALSYELTKEQMYSRLASIISTVHSWSDIEKDHDIITGVMANYLNQISSRLRIENNWTIDQIKAASKNFDVIIVDYAQRMPFDGTDERAGIKNNCRELSNLTRDGKMIILISSIPRSMYDKEGKNVFKETGDIEYICQSGYILSKMTPEIAQLKMIKNTRGVCKEIYLQMDYAHQRIKETLKPEFRNLME